MHYSKKDILELDKISRLNLINSVTGVKPANLIGTVSEKGVENLAIFSSVVHMGSNPAIIGFMTRPIDVIPRDTYQNILDTECYTINHIQSNQIKQAHYTSAKFDASVSEFDRCGFTSEYKNDFQAPFVKGSNCQIGLKLKEIIPIKINDTALVIGEVVHVYVAEDSLSEDLQLNLDAIDSIAISGLNRYYTLNFEKELPFARVKDVPQF